jgi:arylsulfatase A-like enzyme
VSMRKRLAWVLVGLLAWAGMGSPAAAADRPNILWITCEDISPNLGCYGDPDAITPNLDALAKEGVLYTHAFAMAGVCAPSRSCLITGMYPSSLGTQHMRCTGNLPRFVRPFTQYLRAAGYYCSNNSKQDYNFKTPKGTWDESSRKAHWRKRKAGQPFFSVFNFTVSHESQIRTFRGQTKGLSKEELHDPAKVHLPPFYPDTPVVRKDWARYLDLITVMDKQAAGVLRELKEDGLEEDTIVFFYSDHGVGLPRGKRWIYDTGLHVPLIIRFPKKYQDGAPGKPGTTTDRLVSFIDFGPTALSLAGIKPKAHIQGKPFLGRYEAPPREAIYGIRDRMDERPDFTRCVRTKKFKYIRNYMWYLPWAQTINYMEQMPTMKELRRLKVAGKLKGPPALWMRDQKPFEELYDTEKDPYEINNLVDSPIHQAVLKRLRQMHIEWARQTKDLSFLPEPEIHLRSGKTPPYVMARQERKYPLEKIRRAAETLAAEGDVVPRLLELTKDADSAVRFWAVTGLGVRGKGSEKALEAARKAAKDKSPVVRVAAGDALFRLGHAEEAVPVLSKAFQHENPWVRHRAVVILDRMGKKARPALDLIRAGKKDPNNYVQRIVTHVLAGFGG